MNNNKSEGAVNEINQGVFFREFTYSKNEFKAGKLALELADHVVWLDELFFIFQIKDRNPTNAEDGTRWFQNKIISKAVRQIKSTIQYLNEYKHIPLVNNKGHEFNLSDARELVKRKVIVYNPAGNFPEEKRNLKFHKSTQIGLVHLFHIGDYKLVCKYLKTPAEVEEYLDFREKLFEKQGNVIARLSEQYVLGHFFETLEVNHIELRYIDNVRDFDLEDRDFDVSWIVNTFSNRIRLTDEVTQYYPILREIAKLKRIELKEFKKRFVKALEQCKLEKLISPYRMYVPRTNCGFIFIPLPKSRAKNWEKDLHVYTLGHKYDLKAYRCVGVTINAHEQDYIDMNWLFVEQEWSYNAELAVAIETEAPFRPVSAKKMKNIYTKKS